MAYHVEFVELVRDYLAQVNGLTDADLAAVVDGIIAELSQDADRFHALYPLAHESFCFRYDYAHSTAHAIYHFDFVVSGQHMEMGVVQVVYVECVVQPI